MHIQLLALAQGREIVDDDLAWLNSAGQLLYFSSLLCRGWSDTEIQSQNTEGGEEQTDEYRTLI